MKLWLEYIADINHGKALGFAVLFGGLSGFVIWLLAGNTRPFALGAGIAAINGTLALMHVYIYAYFSPRYRRTFLKPGSEFLPKRRAAPAEPAEEGE